MKPYLFMSVATLTASAAFADDITNADRILCSATKVAVCFESSECVDMLPFEINMPQFIVVDEKKMTISTTKASEENRSTPIRLFERKEGKIIFQGIEQERAFSVVIDEEFGLLTGSVARDGVSVSVFGSCTDADT